MLGPSAVERLLKRDRVIVAAALSLIVAASWAYLLAGAGMDMPDSRIASLPMAPGASSPDPAGDIAAMLGDAARAIATPAGWTPGYAALMFLMWWIMMVAMMIPGAAPVVLLHAALARRSTLRAGASGAPWATVAFTLGYLAAWGAFSAVAVAFQWGFESAGLLSPRMLDSTSTAFAAGILLLAGAYQLTPLKQACLRHCRGPVAFLTRHWRKGTAGAFGMGLRHGAFCLGCCWALMALLFFGGIMNLYWIVGLALFVMIEKTLPRGVGIGRGAGAALLAGGGMLLVAAGTH